MESLSDNWLQWMEMIWSVLKQMRFALRGFAVKNSNLAWFGFLRMVLSMCMRVLSSLNTGNICILWRSSMTSEYLTSFVCTAFNF